MTASGLEVVFKTVNGNATTEVRRYVGNALMKYTYTGSSAIPTKSTEYIFKDHLGSTDTILTLNGSLDTVTKVSFGGFGERRAGFTNTGLTSTQLSTILNITDKGYTGHEQLDDVGLIHMNGRVYDPKLGRFMSADPHIQAPTDTQSLNRYSYVLNNPMSATDPSGYFFKKFVKKWGRSIIGAVAAYYTFGAASAWALNAYGASCAVACSLATGSLISSVAGGIAAGFVAGGLASGTFKGALAGAFNGGLANSEESFGFANYLRLAGSLLSTTNKTTAGTSSSATGGKFANGADTGAFTAARSTSAEANYKRDVQPIGKYLDGSKRRDYFEKAKLQAILFINQSDAFATEALREQYLRLFENTFITIDNDIDVFSVPGGDIATSDFDLKRITVHKPFFSISGRRLPSGTVQWEPKSLTLKRMAGVLLHELRHQTTVNHAMGTPETRLRARFSREYYLKAPFEIDAFKFEAVVSGKRKGQINDF